MADLSGGKTTDDVLSSLDEEDVKKLVKAAQIAHPDAFPTGDTGKVAIWIIGLIVVALIAIGDGLLIWQLSETKTDLSAAWAILAAAVAGVLGLFTRSPIT